MNIIIRHGYQFNLMAFPGAFRESLRQQVRVSAFADTADQNNNPAHASESLLLCIISSRISTALATIFGQNSVNR